MATSSSVSDGDPAGPQSSIYERPPKPATNRAAAVAAKVASGAVAGAAAAFVLAELGVPHIFGYGRFALMVPLLAIGGIAAVTRAGRVMTWMALALILIMMLIGATDIMRAPIARLIRADPMPTSADAIVVLSAGVTADGLLQQQGLDRLLKGIELARAGVSRRIVLTRERKKVAGRWITSAEDQSRLIAMSGGAEVISTGIVTSTREEALRVAEYARRAGWKRIVLVTSPLHSRRACATFEHVGLTVSCVPSDSRDIAVKNLVGRDNNLRAFGMWIYELAGTLRYWQAGWI
jgi:uncharacterized SAM-binding protein YcdF (DUF218 family)